MKHTHKKLITSILILILIAMSATTAFCAQENSASESTEELTDEMKSLLASYISVPLTATMKPERKYVLKYNNDEKKYDILEMGTGRKVDLTGWVFVHDPDTPSDNWYYFDKNTKNIKTGWIEDEGSVYYLHDKKDKLTGRVYSGWHDIKGVIYFFNENNFALEKVMSKQDAKAEKIETVEDSLEKAIKELQAAENAKKMQEQNLRNAASNVRNNNSYNMSSTLGNNLGNSAASGVPIGAGNPADAMRQAQIAGQNGGTGLTGEDLVRILNERNSQIR